MSKIVFVPLTDEMIFERPDMITGPIMTYKSAIFENRNRCVSARESLQASGAYLKGDLVNGLDVVYDTDKPTRRIKAKKYRGLSRGIPVS